MQNAGFLVILKLLTISFFGFFLYKIKFIKEENLRFLSKFLINVTIPALFFSHICRYFSFHSRPSWLVFVLLSVIIFAAGLVLGLSLGLFKPFRKNLAESVSLVAFQNSGYLPMNIAFFMFSSPKREVFLNYIFLYLLGFNILMWSVGSFFIFRRRRERFSFSSLFNMPVISALFALVLVKLGIGAKIPPFIISPLEMVGSLSFSLSMIVLGASLGKIGAKESVLNYKLIIPVSVLRLFVIPSLAMFWLYHSNMGGLLGFFILLESAQPAAVSLPILGLWKERNHHYLAQAVLFMHLASLILLPLWIDIFLKNIGL